MKRVALIILFLAISLSIFSKQTYFDNVSFYSTLLDAYSNPASLAFREDLDKKFIVSFDYNDTLDSKLRGERLFLFQNHNSLFNLSFASKSTLFSLFVDSSVKDRHLNESLHFNFIQEATIQVDTSFKIYDFGFGFKVKGGSSSIRSDKEVNNIFDILGNYLFAEYKSLENSEFFSLGMGLQYNIENISIGLYTDELLASGAGSRDISMSIDRIMSTLSYGISYRFNEFDRDDERALVRPRFALEVKNDGLNKINLKLTSDFKLQLLPRFNIDLSLSYFDVRRNILADGESRQIGYKVAVEAGKSLFSLSCYTLLDERNKVSFTLAYKSIL